MLKKTISKIKPIWQKKLVQGSMVILAGNLAASFLNYLYHLVCAKFLDPADFGLLESMVSFTYFIIVFTSAFSFAVVNLIGKSAKTEISLIIASLEKQALKLSMVLFAGLLAMYPFSRILLHIDSFWLYLIFSSQAFFSFIPAIYLASLQAKFKFVHYSLVGIFGSVAKISLTFVFLLWSWRVIGALAGFVFSGLAVMLAAKYLTARLWPKAGHKNEAGFVLAKTFWHYSLLSLVVNLCLISLYSTDVIMARFWLTPYEAGIYAALTLMGKIIFFGCSAILIVAFPVFTNCQKNKALLSKNLGLTFTLTTVVGLAGVFVYHRFPHLVILLLGGKYNEAVVWLGYISWLGLALVLFSLIVQFFLAIEKKTAAYLSAAIAVVQVLFIVLKHSGIKDIINDSLLSLSIGILLGLWLVWREMSLFDQNKTKL